MKRLALVASVALLCAAGCKKEKPSPLLQQNNETTNNGGTNGSTNGTPNGTSNVNGITSEIIPADPDRDYSGTVPTYSGGAAGQFVHDLNTAECEEMFSCLTSSNVLFQLKSWRVSNIGECVAARNAMRSPAVAQAASDAGRTVVDGAAATACLEDIRNFDCTTVGVASIDVMTMLPVCQEVLVGTAPQGEVCDQNWDCGTGLYCSQSFDSCYGLCESVDNFANTCGEEVCELSEFCDQANLSCAPLYGANSECFLDSQCGESLVCFEGSCQALTVVAEESGCGGQYLCRPGLQCTDGKCAPLLGPDSACDSSFQCDWSLNCGSGLCSASSTACERGDDCPSRRCLDGQCVGANESCYEVDPL